MGGWGSFNWEILSGGGAQAVLEIQVEAWVKKQCLPLGERVDFFWNNPITFTTTKKHSQGCH